VTSQLKSTLFALACVLAISTGQVLFKEAARAISHAGSIFAQRPLAILLVALAIYGGATLAWIYLLRITELSKVYPIMALSFVFVPLAARAFFGEEITPLYWAGIFLIASGVALIAFASRP
jgi:drug/metabolite transporter (DMT)-like permease